MKPLRVIKCVLLAAAACTALTAEGWTAPVGEAASVVPASNYARNGAPDKPLAIRDSLEQNDRIKTTSGGSTQVKFLDDTLLTIGPNSEVLLDEFVFDGNKARKATVEVVKGAMRFVSGTSERQAYEIKTPVATIGVRGTVVDIGFVNGRWSFNAVDGTITARLTSTGETRTVSAGQPGFSVTRNGFVPLNPNDARQLWQRLDNAHSALAKASGSNPSAPTGAAAGGPPRGDGDVTGSVPGQGGQQGQQGGQQGAQGGGGPGIGGIGTQYSTPPVQTVVTTTGSTTGGVPTAIVPTTYADFNAIVAAGVVNLGAVSTSPPFTGVDPLHINGTGGNLPTQDFEVDGIPGRLYISAANAKFDLTNNIFRAGVLQLDAMSSTPSVAFGRISAGASEVTTVTSGPDTIYQIGRWHSGAIGYVSSGGEVDTSGNVTLTPNQGLHYLLFNYSGGLDNNGGVFSGQRVLFSLESSTKPTWSDGRNAPGTFTGSLAVLFDTNALKYGLTGTITMGSNSLTMQTAGGIADPSQSGASIALAGGTGRIYAPLTIAGTLCSGCSGEVDFLNVAANKVGVAYYVANTSANVPEGQDYPSIDGIAVFGSPSLPAAGAPAFTASTMSVMAVGGGGTDVTLNVGPFLNRGLSDLTSLEFDANGALKTLTVKGTSAGISDPNAGTLTRVTAQVADLYTDPSATPLYQIGRWTNGQVTATVNGQVILTEDLTPQQGLHYIIFGYTNGLYDSNNRFEFGKTVTYSLEKATSPTYVTGSAGPGTFTGTLAVAFGTLSVSYGLQAQLNMGSGDVITMQTMGGVTNPEQSGAVASVLGGIYRPAFTAVTGSGGSCTGNSCIGLVNFLPVSNDKVGVFYAMEISNQTTFINLVEGAAVFGSPSTAVVGSEYAKPIGAFADLSGTLHLGAATGTAQVSGSTVSILNFSNGTETVTKLTAQSVDNGSYGFIGWERWTNGTYQVDGGTNPGEKIVPLNGGVHMIHGIGATLPFANVSGVSDTKVQYDLVGGTKPTLASGGLTPGTLGAGSKLGVDFTAGAGNTVGSVGVDLYVNIGGGAFHLNTPGGAATPSNGGLQINTNGVFGGTVGVGISGTAVSACTTAGSCTGGIGGFLSDYESTGIGLTYAFGNNQSDFISGVAAFGRSMPVSNIGMIGYADQFNSADHQILTGKLQDFNSSSGSLTDMALVKDNTTATGLSVNSFNLEVDTPKFGWHRIETGSPSTAGKSLDQGVVSGVLGWERLTGTLHQHTSTGAGPDIYLSDNQGVHIIHGVAATNVPTNVTYQYNLVGGTAPTIADGSVAAGSITSGQVGVNFSSTAPKFGVNLNVNMGSEGTYAIASTNGAANPSIAAPNLHSQGTFGTGALATGNGITATNSGGSNNVCGGASTCAATVNGFLAGDAAKGLGIMYQFGSSAAKTVTGAAGFTRP